MKNSNVEYLKKEYKISESEAIELDTGKRGITKRHIWINYGKAIE